MKEKDSCGVGFIVNIKGEKSHEIVKSALEGLSNLNHRGAVSADGKTGDGAGILTQIPYKFFEKVLKQSISNANLAIGVMFLPNHKQEEIKKEINEIINNKFKVIAWREIPVNYEELGVIAEKTKPALWQCFISKENVECLDYEKALFILRKKLEKLSLKTEYKNFYIASFSSKTIVYKGLITAPRVGHFYKDLQDPDYETAIALFHQRYSTNTSPTWKFAHPFRMLAHNGEINTINANRNFIKAKIADIKEVWGADCEDIFPLVNDEDSDSASLDNVLEFLIRSGLDPFVASNMLIPKAWENDENLSPEEKAFYEYFSYGMESWDGPAAIAFTDGEIVGGKLDRNGLRPARYLITKDKVILSSEVGVIDIPQEEIIKKGRLAPGDKISIDTRTGKIYFSDEIVDKLIEGKEYKKWLDENSAKFKAEKENLELETKDITRERIFFGLDQDQAEMVLKTMIEKGTELIYSMGSDIPLSILSKKPKLFYSYFKQKFAQVTNPAIDPIREKKVMSLRTYIGKHGNFLKEDPENVHMFSLETSLIFDHELETLINHFGKRLKILECSFDKNKGLEAGLNELENELMQALQEKVETIVLSDREISENRIPIPMGLAIACLNTKGISEGVRGKFSIIADTGEVSDTHSFAFLLAYGATLVNPYLSVQLIKNICQEINLDFNMAIMNYRKAMNSGLLKIMAKMGISTVRSYRNSALFEPVGISEKVINKYFKGTTSQIGGLELEDIEEEILERYEIAFKSENPIIKSLGEFRQVKDGEFHSWNPQTVRSLQKAVREKNWDEYKNFVKFAYANKPCNIRDLLDIKSDKSSIDINQVEEENEIFKRFVASAMSIGALSKEAHETISEAFNRLGALSDSGEGGEDALRYKTIKNSKIKQIASGRFGVTPEYLNSAEEIEIKVSQGAKPGEGGHLPAKKVDTYIASLRYAKAGMDLISPPPHHDIYSIEDLAQLIYDLKMINPQAKVIVKLTSENGIGTIASGVVKAFADIIKISGFDGGTGAAGLSSIMHTGGPIELGLAETQQALIMNDLRDKVKIRVDGGLKTARDIIISALLGAEEYGFGTALMVACGCCMDRKCHLNTCPVGIATQNSELRAKYKGEVEFVMTYLRYIAREIREILAEMGYISLDEIIGRSDLLISNIKESDKKLKNLNISNLLRTDLVKSGRALKCTAFRSIIKIPYDEQVIGDVVDALEKKKSFEGNYKLKNVHRTVGAEISHEIVKRFGNDGLKDSEIKLNFTGTAGQSFGAFCVNGLNLYLEGQANDYVAKSMNGGLIAISPFSSIKEQSNEHVVIGNTVLYGATGGELFVAGIAGERFAVRNSGACAVVEGIGEHGCEYMIRGHILILGEIGNNFGAGMTGGTAYIYDKKNVGPKRINSDSVCIKNLEEFDNITIKTLIEKHLEYTGSSLAKKLLEDFSLEILKFKKVEAIS